MKPQGQAAEEAVSAATDEPDASVPSVEEAGDAEAAADEQAPQEAADDDSDDAAEIATADGVEDAETPKKRRPSKKVVIPCVVVVVLALAAAIFAGFWTGMFVPGDAAAKYNGLHYVTEQEVSDYIDSYKKQMGVEDADDETWAQFLADCDLTPQTLRMYTIRQLIMTQLVRSKAAEVGVSVSDDELNEYVTNIKNNLGLGDDEIYKQTIEAQGQTVEEAEQGYEDLILEQKLFEQEVPTPTPADDEIKSYLKSAYPSGTTTKHVYYFTIDGLDDEGEYEKFSKVQQIHKQLVKAGLSKKNFKAIVEQYSNNDDLVKRGGANGWDLDMDDYSENYQNAVSDLEKGGLSEVFTDSNGYSFVWIDTTYTLDKPTDADDGGYKLKDIPDTLEEYFSDSAAHQLWQTDCQEYLQKLYDESDIEVYAMPSDASYNVDMSSVTSGDSDSSSDDADAGESSSSDGSSDSAESSSNG